MKLHRKIAKIFGYELIKRNKHPTLSSHIINLINPYKIDLVLDVGANYGQFGRMLRNEGYKGEIHSFEPVSHSYDNLQKACLNDEKWFVHKLAMGAADGKDAINVTEASDMSSFLDPNDFGGSSILDKDGRIKIQPNIKVRERKNPGSDSAV